MDSVAMAASNLPCQKAQPAHSMYEQNSRPSQGEIKKKAFASAKKGDTKTLIALCKDDPDLLDITDWKGRSLLMTAALFNRSHAVKLLLDHGARTDLIDQNGKTGLHHAAEGNATGCISYLLSKTAQDDKIHKDKRGLSASMVALSLENIDMGLLLITGGVPLAGEVHAKGKNALHYIATSGRLDCLQAALQDPNHGEWINKQDVEGNTPLLYAVQSGANAEEMAKMLLCHGAKAMVQNRKKKSALHIAAQTASSTLFQLLLNEAFKEDKAALEAELNSEDDNNKTPLMYAAERKRSDICLMIATNGGHCLRGNFKEMLEDFRDNSFKLDLDVVKAIFRSPTQRKEVEDFCKKFSKEALLNNLTSIPMTNYQAQIVWFLLDEEILTLESSNAKYVRDAWAKQQDSNGYVLMSKLALNGNEICCSLMWEHGQTSSLYHRLLDIFGSLTEYELDSLTDIEQLKVRWQEMSLFSMACSLDDPAAAEQLQHKITELYNQEVGREVLTGFQIAALKGTKDMRGTYKTLELLIEKNPGIGTWADKEQRTAWHYLALSNLDEDSIIKLMKKLSPSGESARRDESNITPLWLAVKCGKVKTAEFLLHNARGLPQAVPSLLCLAIEAKSEELVELILEHFGIYAWAEEAPDGSYPALLLLYYATRETTTPDWAKSCCKMLSSIQETPFYKNHPNFHRKAYVELCNRVPGLLQRGSEYPNGLDSGNSSQNHVSLKPYFQLKEIAREYPYFNGEVENKMTFSDFDAARYCPKICLPRCFLEKGLIIQYLETLIDIAKDNGVQWPLQCKGKTEAHNNDEESHENCLMFLDLLSMAKALQECLNMKECKIAFLGPCFRLIGSTVEGTRLGWLSECDITLIFKKLTKKLFILSKNAGHLGLTEEGQKLMKEHLPDLLHESGELNYNALFRHLLDSLKAALRIVIPTLQRYDPVRDFQACNECRPLKECPAIREHCKTRDKIPSVTFTKLGPCLVLPWKKSADFWREHVCTIDLIPLFEHPASTMDLYKHYLSTLIDETPQDWEMTFGKYLNRDRIISEASATYHYHELQGRPKSRKGISLIGMKIQNFSGDDNFLLRPGQSLNIRELMGKLKELYLNIKLFKAMYEQQKFTEDITEYFRNNPPESPSDRACLDKLKEQFREEGVKSNLDNYFVKKLLCQRQNLEMAKRNQNAAWYHLMRGQLKEHFSIIWNPLNKDKDDDRIIFEDYYEHLLGCFEHGEVTVFNWKRSEK